MNKTQYIATPVLHGNILVDKVDSYVYQGRAVSCTSPLDIELSRRIRAGWAAFHNIVMKLLCAAKKPARV